MKGHERSRSHIAYSNYTINDLVVCYGVVLSFI